VLPPTKLNVCDVGSPVCQNFQKTYWRWPCASSPESESSVHPAGVAHVTPAVCCEIVTGQISPSAMPVGALIVNPVCATVFELTTAVPRRAGAAMC
jgi:hypothetical protein